MSLKQLIKPATMVVSVVAAACPEFFRQHDCSGSSLVTKATQPSVVVPETRRYYSAALERPSWVLATVTALLVAYVKLALKTKVPQKYTTPAPYCLVFDLVLFI